MFKGDLTRADLSVLDYLLNAERVTPGLIRYDTGAEPKDLQRAVKHLIDHGCAIEAHPDGSYQLMETGLATWADYLREFLPSEYRRTVEVYRDTASTQDTAKRRSREKLVVIADHQTAGRGRLGRSWLAPPGTAVLMSLTFALSGEQTQAIDRLSMIISVAIADAIEKMTGHGMVNIKWPNDLYVNGRKIAGILIETDASQKTAIVGIGINVKLTDNHLRDLPAELREKITSFTMCGWPKDRLHVARRVIERIDELMASEHLSLIVDEWRCRNQLRDEHTRFQSNGKTIVGQAVDIDPDEGLIVRRDSGEIVHLHAATTTVL